MNIDITNNAIDKRIRIKGKEGKRQASQIAYYEKEAEKDKEQLIRCNQKHKYFMIHKILFNPYVIRKDRLCKSYSYTEDERVDKFICIAKKTKGSVKFRIQVYKPEYMFKIYIGRDLVTECKTQRQVVEYIMKRFDMKSFEG